MNYSAKRGNSSVGRAQPCQGWGREFEPRFPLTFFENLTIQKLRNFRCQRVQQKIPSFQETAEIAQLVEHNLAKVGVASSSLVFRSNSLKI